MELRTLRYFLAVAGEENITKAADILHVTQPTLSRQMVDLEKELGTTMMLRGKSRLTLTDDGIFFRQRAEEIVELADRLDKGLLDVGLLLESVDTVKYDFIRLSQKETWGVLMRDDHPLAFRESIRPEEAANYPLILPLRERVRAEILNWLKREEKDLNIPLSYTLLSNAALLVEEGLGCAFCLDGALAIHSSPRLRFVPVYPEHMTRSALIWKKKHLFSPAASLFIQEINMLRAQIE